MTELSGVLMNLRVVFDFPSRVADGELKTTWIFLFNERNGLRESYLTLHELDCRGTRGTGWSSYGGGKTI